MTGGDGGPSPTPASSDFMQRLCASVGASAAALYVADVNGTWAEFASAGDAPPPAPPTDSSSFDDPATLDLEMLRRRGGGVPNDGSDQAFIVMRFPARDLHGQLVGALCIALPGPRAPDEKDGVRAGAVLQAGAEMAGVVIAADLLAADREQRLSRERAVSSVVSAASRHLNMDDLLQAALGAFRAGVRSQSVWIRAFDSPESSGLHRFAASFPPETDSLATPEVLDIVGRAVHACWDLGEANILHAGDGAAPEREVTQDGVERQSPLTTTAEREFMYSIMRLVGARSMLLAPLGGDSQCEGFISLTRSLDQDPFTSDDARTALRIGQELGEAIVRSRRFSDQLHAVSDLQMAARHHELFVSTAVHQIRNPLTAILLHTELLADEGVTSPSVASIGRGAERLLSAVDDLLTLSRHGAGHPGPVAKEVSMTQLAARVCASLQAIAAKQHIALELVTTSDVTAWGDETALERLVDNLVGNAVKYSLPGGQVRVSVVHTESSVVFECRDDGRGISDAEQQHLFDDFTRSADPAIQALPGSGLGLAIVRRIVDQHHGSVDVVSELGIGSRFRVYLPRHAMPGP